MCGRINSVTEAYLQKQEWINFIIVIQSPVERRKTPIALTVTQTVRFEIAFPVPVHQN